MSSSGDGLPIALELFSLLEQYGAAIEQGKVDTKKSVGRDTPVVQFCIAFFQQFFEHEHGLEITGIDETSKVAVIAVRLKLKRRRNVDSTRRLFFLFQDLCDAWPDILGFSYGGSQTEFRRFHAVYVPRLISRIEIWARNHGYRQIADRAREAARVYVPAAKKL
jgi:hypothetical protein